VLDACLQLTAVLSTGPEQPSYASRSSVRYNERMPVLAAARKDLTELIRNETGRPPAQLFHTNTGQSPPADAA